MKIKSYCTGIMAAAAALLSWSPGEVEAQGMSASAAAMLEEVVVTARRREESLQDLPLSIAAISADAMQAQGIYDIKDIQEFVPNVAFRDQDRRGRGSIFIRGIGSGGPGSFRPVGAGLYLDGHYMPGNNSKVLSTLDMERVEVLRGPQGTLFGKNTTGGAVQFITAKPQPEFDADILLRAADFGQQDFRGMINIPISDTVSTRFALAKETADGYYYNRNLGRDYGETDIEAFSAALRWTPNDNWVIDFLARGNYDESDNNGGTCRVFPDQEMYDNMVAQHGAAVSSVAAFQPQPNGVGQWGGSNANGSVGHVDRIYTGATLDMWTNCTIDNTTDNFTTSGQQDGFVFQDQNFFNVTADWNSNGPVGGLDNLNVRLIGGRMARRTWNWADRDYTPVSVDAIGSSTGLRDNPGPGQSAETESFEVILTGDINDRLSFTTGVHYFYELNSTGEQDCLKTFKSNFDLIRNDFTEVPDGMGGTELVGGNVAIPCNADGGTQFDRLTDRTALGGPGVGAMSGFLENESIAVFAHVTWDIAENWSLDLGARWTEEDRWFNLVEFNTVPGTCVVSPAHYLNPLLPNAPTTGPANPGAPPRTARCAPDYFLTFENTFQTGFANDLRETFSEVTPMVSITRTLQGGDVLTSGILYGTISEGFLTGAFNDELNVSLVPELTPLLAYDPEHVTNYEFGFKGTLADGRLRVATSVFYMDYQDKQEEIDIDNSDGRFGGDPQIGIVTNAATVDIYGIELEVRAQPWDGGFLSVDLGWLDNEYGQFASFDPNAPGGTIDRSNLTIEDYSPDWTLNLSLEHAFLLGNGATLTPLIGMYAQDDFDFISGLDQNSPPSHCNNDSYTTFRARLTYEPADARWQASLFGNNITDELYYDYCDDARSGVFDYRYNKPSTWGAEFVYRWGG